jgi:hypothetical protein
MGKLRQCSRAMLQLFCKILDVKLLLFLFDHRSIGLYACFLGVIRHFFKKVIELVVVNRRKNSSQEGECVFTYDVIIRS